MGAITPLYAGAAPEGLELNDKVRVVMLSAQCCAQTTASADDQIVVAVAYPMGARREVLQRTSL